MKMHSSQPKSARLYDRSTALHHETNRLSRSASLIMGLNFVPALVTGPSSTRLSKSPRPSTSSSVQKPTARPAANAAPSAVVSMEGGLKTGHPKTSACHRGGHMQLNQEKNACLHVQGTSSPAGTHRSGINCKQQSAET